MTHSERKHCFRLINLYEGLADDIGTSFNISFFRKKTCVLAVLLFYFSSLLTAIVLTPKILTTYTFCNMHNVFEANKIVSVL